VETSEPGSDLPERPAGQARDAYDELGRLLLRGRTLDEVLTRLTELVAATVPGADQVSLTVTGPGGPRTAASSGPVAVDLDHHQYATGDGPCLDAARTGGVVRVPDTAAEQHYADFAAAAHERGVRSSFSLGLPARRRSPGALNLYRVQTPDDVDEQGEELVGLFASFAAVALVNAESSGPAERRTRYLHLALRHRAVVDQATGIVMVRERCDATRAYELLAARARAQDRPLLAVATAVVEGVEED